MRYCNAYFGAIGIDNRNNYTYKDTAMVFCWKLLISAHHQVPRVSLTSFTTPFPNHKGSSSSWWPPLEGEESALSSPPSMLLTSTGSSTLLMMLLWMWKKSDCGCLDCLSATVVEMIRNKFCESSRTFFHLLATDLHFCLSPREETSAARRGQGELPTCIGGSCRCHTANPKAVRPKRMTSSHRDTNTSSHLMGKS